MAGDDILGFKITVLGLSWIVMGLQAWSWYKAKKKYQGIMERYMKAGTAVPPDMQERLGKVAGPGGKGISIGIIFALVAEGLLWMASMA